MQRARAPKRNPSRRGGCGGRGPGVTCAGPAAEKRQIAHLRCGLRMSPPGDEPERGLRAGAGG